MDFIVCEAPINVKFFEKHWRYIMSRVRTALFVQLITVSTFSTCVAWA